MRHVGSITVIADCTSVNLLDSSDVRVSREKPDITRLKLSMIAAISVSLPQNQQVDKCQ